MRCTDRKQKWFVLPSASVHSEAGKTPAQFFPPKPWSAPEEIIQLHKILIKSLTVVHFVFHQKPVSTEQGSEKMDAQQREHLSHGVKEKLNH